MARVLLWLAVMAGAAVAAGCVRRTLEISSDPPGALVYLNDREVGRTPVEVDFTYYGRYDVRLTKDGHEALLTSGEAKSPIWDTIPLDLAAEAVPGEPHVRIKWHYTLQRLNDDPAALAERARELRAKLEGQPKPPPPSDAPAPPDDDEP
jgi:PEGA domain